MLPRVLIFLVALCSFPTLAGKITIEKKDSVIRNDLFEQKRARAEAYQHSEENRRRNNEIWSYRLAPECVLLRHYYLIYRCAAGQYYKGYQTPDKMQYRQLSEQEVKKLHSKSE